MLAVQTDPNTALEVLRRAPLRNVVLLKFLQACPGGSRVYQIVRGSCAATLLIFDHRFSDFDRETYPQASASAIISSDHPDLTRELLGFVPQGESLVFKLSSDADRGVVAEKFVLERRFAFLSYTSAGAIPLDARAKIGTTCAAAPFRLFEEQGYCAEWLGSLINAGRAFTSVVEEAGKALAACFAFQVDGAVWEIGGVYTLPEERGRGLASRVVHAALAELERAGRVPRYQVAETNLASIRLAEAVGMTNYLTLTHYMTVGGGNR
ncbi:hypothetical protein ASC97_19595 [Rhizobium sp. Root1203]|uniref:GNAT family N-acetyltransferase n=1 Tax=Rhizobium sp. Root1203 TaxID=1736427 RepID=UPI00070E12BD|nr:GNAT family N-acetyltransferase [Rhizobium sp. Root1203]KQV31568.1 hypothetical protein ASC97_19595 [Rhizobium sp. Root1203]